jgi:quercetin dioxygenase-like cupin family protein
MSTIIGFDAGNSEATLTTQNGGKGSSLTIPSYLGNGSLDELLRMRGGANVESLGAGEYVLEFGGRSSFVGQLALEQARNGSSGRGDVSRYWTGHTLRLLLALCGAAIKGSTMTVAVVTGLPVAVWSKETAKKVQQCLAGTHKFTLNGRARTLHVEAVMVMMEGAGALAAHGLASDVAQAVIDVGGRTTDLFWAQGMRPDISRCAGLDVGIELAGDQLCASFLHSYKRELRRTELRGVFRAHAIGAQPPAIYASGQPVHLNGEVGAAIATVADQVASFVASTWRSSERGSVAGEAARVLLIGGGAHYLASQLKELIPHLEVPRNPELANAQGYLAVGLQIPEAGWAKLRGAA